jgi:hypothetical protein
MSAATAAVLRAAVANPVVVARYHSHVLVRGDNECWIWTAAVSGRGHGRSTSATPTCMTARAGGTG